MTNKNCTVANRSFVLSLHILHSFFYHCFFSTQHYYLLAIASESEKQPSKHKTDTTAERQNDMPPATAAF